MILKNKRFDEYGHYIDEDGNVIDETGRVWKKEDSWYRIGLFELNCGIMGDDEIEVPSFCKYGRGKLGNYCLENLCSHILMCTVPFTLAYTNKYGYMNCDVGFPEGIYFEEEIDERTKKLLSIWGELCHKKIDEVEKEYNDKEKPL